MLEQWFTRACDRQRTREILSVRCWSGMWPTWLLGATYAGASIAIRVLSSTSVGGLAGGL